MERRQTTASAVDRPTPTSASATGRGRVSGTPSTAVLPTASVRGSGTGTAIVSGIGIGTVSEIGMRTARETAATIAQTSAGEHALQVGQGLSKGVGMLVALVVFAALSHRAAALVKA